MLRFVTTNWSQLSVLEYPIKGGQSWAIDLKQVPAAASVARCVSRPRKSLWSPAIATVRIAGGTTAGRAFCDQCGTPLTIESEKHDPPNIEFHISTFDDPDAYVPSLHWYHSRRLAWFDVADDLPRYHGLDGDGEEPYRHGPVTKGLPG